MSTLKATNIKNESSASNNIVLDSGGGVVVNNGVTLGTGTTISSPASDTFAVSTNGSERVRVDSSGNINVDSGGVYYDATNNRLAIGTTSPGAVLHVANATNPQAYLQRAGTDTLEVGVDTSGSYVASNSAHLGFRTGGATSADEAVRIDSSGRLLVGTSSTSGSGLVQVRNDGGGVCFDGFRAVESTTGAPVFRLNKSRGTGASPTEVSSGDVLGYLAFAGYDGAAFADAAYITAIADGTWTDGGDTTDNPGALVFSTTANGASSPTERLKIYEGGYIDVLNCPSLNPLTDNATLLGNNGRRWSAVWAANGTIQTSDIRTKTDIADAALGSTFIKALRPVSYKWIEGGKVDSGKRDDNHNYIYEAIPGKRTHWGFIAQEVKQAVDAAGVDFGGWVLTDKDDPDSQQALRYDQFIAPLTKALQEALEKIETLEAKVAALETP